MGPSKLNSSLPSAAWVSIGSGNGLSPVRRRAITWNNAGLLSIELLGTNFSEFRIRILSFSFKKMHLKLSSAKVAAILIRGRWVNISARCRQAAEPVYMRITGSWMCIQEFCRQLKMYTCALQGVGYICMSFEGSCRCTQTLHATVHIHEFAGNWMCINEHYMQLKVYAWALKAATGAYISFACKWMCLHEFACSWMCIH